MTVGNQYCAGCNIYCTLRFVLNALQRHPFGTVRAHDSVANVDEELQCGDVGRILYTTVSRLAGSTKLNHTMSYVESSIFGGGDAGVIVGVGDDRLIARTAKWDFVSYSNPMCYSHARTRLFFLPTYTKT
jgi:hypothetical protein